MAITVGIDLGTTYSALSYFDAKSGKPVILKNSKDKDITPSVIYIKDGKVLIGEDAKYRQTTGAINNCASFYKCMMGDLSFTVNIDGNDYNAEDLSSLFLKELVKDISNKNNIVIDGVVITVPAYFNEAQRMSTMNAGKRAGLRLLKIINEPTAAVIAYELGETEKEKTVLVYDLGGGTFDITIAKILTDGIKVIATIGNHNLGGKNWDCALRNYIVSEFYNLTDVNIETEDTDYFAELLFACEVVKKQLTDSDVAYLQVSCGGQCEKIEITLELFNSITANCLSMTTDLIEEVFEEIGNGFSYKDIDEVVLVGGATRMRQVYEFMAQNTNTKINKDIDVDCVVSLGAAIQAEICSKQTASLTLKSRTASGEKRLLTINSKSIVDVTSHSMGAVTIDDDNTKYINTIIIKKNSSIPTEQTKKMAIANIGSKTFLNIFITQGETYEPMNCNILGRYNISGFDEESAKEIQVEIKYIYDENGMVNVEAKQIASNKNLLVVQNEIGDYSWMGQPPIVQKQVETIKDIYLLLDSSGSMCGNLPKATTAARNFVKSLTGINNFSILVFAEKSKYLCQNTNDLTSVENAFSIYEKDKSDVGCGTSACPLKSILNDTRKSNNLIYVVVFTDGVWVNQNAETATSKILAKECNAEIIAVGIGDADKNFLKQIATSDSFALKTDIANLGTSFSGIARAINTNKREIR